MNEAIREFVLLRLQALVALVELVAMVQLLLGILSAVRDDLRGIPVRVGWDRQRRRLTLQHRPLIDEEGDAR